MHISKRNAFFLDFDGTLVATMPTPDAVRADDRMRGILQRLRSATDGAAMIVSGRSLADLDSILRMDLPAAGQHGAEIRYASSVLDNVRVGLSDYDNFVAQCRDLATAFPGTNLEEKNPAIALHLARCDPRFEDLLAGARRIVRDSGGRVALFSGHNVVELRPADMHKGRVVEGAAMLAPFAGRTPIFIGNDVPDIDGFNAAARLGGFGISVGEQRPGARYSLPSPEAVLQLLAQVGETG